MLRGGAFKPRTSPYSFQGLGLDGLRYLAKARRATGLAIVTEVMSDTQVEMVAEYADVLQVGSRSMSNWALLAEVAKSRKPVLLKRGMTATVEEYAEAAYFIRGNGNPNIILCERGLRTVSNTATRNTCDIVAVPVLQRLTGLPVIVDPSHATGVRDLVSPLSIAAVAIGADGLIIEVHPDPDRAWSDAEQSLSLPQFRDVVTELQPYLEIWSRKRNAVREAAAHA
jgi:3-deoxy-7-phosphoheptulonate synthase